MNAALWRSAWGVRSERAAAGRSGGREKDLGEQGRKEESKKVRERKTGCDRPLVGQWGSGQCNQLLTFSLNHSCVTFEWSEDVFTDGYERINGGNFKSAEQIGEWERFSCVLSVTG